MPVPPSTFAALAGATVIANLSAQQHHHRQGGLPPAARARRSRRAASPRTSTAGAGSGESTTDLAWDGHAHRSPRTATCSPSPSASPTRRSSSPPTSTSSGSSPTACARRASATAVGDHREQLRRSAASRSSSTPPTGRAARCSGACARFPFVPGDPRERDERCAEVYDIQVAAGSQRGCARPASRSIVIGVSGGLDSTQALLVAARAMDDLGAAAHQRARPTRCPASPPATRTLAQRARG